MQTSEISENIKKEVQLSTDLLAEAGVEEPATFKLMKTKTFLIVFMIFNLVSVSLTSMIECGFTDLSDGQCHGRIYG